MGVGQGYQARDGHISSMCSIASSTFHLASKNFSLGKKSSETHLQGFSLSGMANVVFVAENSRFLDQFRICISPSPVLRPYRVMRMVNNAQQEFDVITQGNDLWLNTKNTRLATSNSAVLASNSLAEASTLASKPMPILYTLLATAANASENIFQRVCDLNFHSKSMSQGK